MKKISTILVCLTIAVSAFSQSSSPAFIHAADNAGYNPFIDEYDLSGNRIPDKSRIQGSPMLNENWGTGSVILKNGQHFNDLNLQFSLEQNQLFFKKDSVVYLFPSPVLEFLIQFNKDGVDKKVYFKSNYPEIGKHTPDNFYEVINDGPKIQLLRYLKSKVEDQYVYNQSSKREYTVSEEWYIYDIKNNKIVKINNNEKSLLKALPNYDAQITAAIAQHNYDLKFDKDIVSLVAEINKGQ